MLQPRHTREYISSPQFALDNEQELNRLRREHNSAADEALDGPAPQEAALSRLDAAKAAVALFMRRLNAIQADGAKKSAVRRRELELERQDRLLQWIVEQIPVVEAGMAAAATARMSQRSMATPIREGTPKRDHGEVDIAEDESPSKRPKHYSLQKANTSHRSSAAPAPSPSQPKGKQAATAHAGPPATVILPPKAPRRSARIAAAREKAAKEKADKEEAAKAKAASKKAAQGKPARQGKSRGQKPAQEKPAQKRAAPAKKRAEKPASAPTRHAAQKPVPQSRGNGNAKDANSTGANGKAGRGGTNNRKRAGRG